MRAVALRPTAARSRDQFWSHWGQMSARVANLLRGWHRRSRGRSELGRMDARMLADFGISRAEAWAEINKPFWRE